MEQVFPKAVQAGLDRARRMARKRRSRLRVRVDDETYPVLRRWKTGFAMAAEAPPRRGLVDLFDGDVHLFQCLIVTSAADAEERQYEYKRATAVAARPAADFVRPDGAPVALIGKPTD